jgi:serine protease Do
MVNFRKGRAVHGKPIFLLLLWFWASGTAAAQTRESASKAAPQSAGRSDALHQLNDSVEALVQRVSPSVVQILVTGYTSSEQEQRGETNLVIGRERAIGSGAIVDPEGYIVTNAHVLNGAEKIEVIVPPQPVAGANLPQDA